jgi:hypothetical protein
VHLHYPKPQYERTMYKIEIRQDLLQTYPCDLTESLFLHLEYSAYGFGIPVTIIGHDPPLCIPVLCNADYLRPLRERYPHVETRATGRIMTLCTYVRGEIPVRVGSMCSDISGPAPTIVLCTKVCLHVCIHLHYPKPPYKKKHQVQFQDTRRSAANRIRVICQKVLFLQVE